jgi:hypothetical protein
MGSASKIILIGATSLIVGIYAVSLKKVQANDARSALVEVKRVQFERVQAASVVSAIQAFMSYGNLLGLQGPSNALGGGTYYFRFSDKWDSTLSGGIWVKNAVNLTVTDTLDGVARLITARIEDSNQRLDANQKYVKQGPRRIHRGTWEVTKYYVYREH